MASGRRDPESAWTNGSHGRHHCVADPQERDAYVFPTSFGQRRLWFLDHIDPGSAVYNMCAALRLRGPLHARSLERALEEIVRRHEVLRTTFVATDGEPMQVVAAAGTLALSKRDLASMAEATRTAKVAALIEAEATRPFDLAGGPLLRCVLLRLGPQDHVLVVVLHHIVADGWSLGVLLGEVSQLYEAYTAGLPSPLPELAVQYADYSVWQRQWLQGEVLERELAYWRQQLAGAPPALELPTDRPRPSSLQRHRGAQRPVRLGLELTQAVRELSRREGATVYMTLLAAWQALLARLTGQSDIAVGTPIAGRTRTETEGLIGFFVNTLVIRTQLGDAPTFAALVGRVRERTLEAYAHQAVPFEKLVEVLAPRRDMSRSPLFQVMFILQNAPVGSLRLGTAAVEVMAVETGTAKFDLTLALEETSDGLRGWVEYSSDLFEAATIERLVGQYTRLLRAGVAAPDTPITRLPLLSQAERTQVLAASTGPLHASSAADTLVRRFEENAARTPQAIAVASDEGQLTYAQLDAQANRISRRLRDLGIGAEVPVAVLLEPSLEMAATLLGILKAGGAYVPLDPSSPRARVDAGLEDAAATVLVTHSSMHERYTARDLAVLAVDEEMSAVATEDSEGAAASERANAVYVLYTSGSTGRPKAVVVEQQHALAYLDAVVARFGLRPGMQYAMVQPLTVDACNTVLLPALFAGGTLHVFPRERATDPEALLAYFTQHRIDVAKIAPSHLAALLEACPRGTLLPQRVLALGGEASAWAWIDGTVLPLASPTLRTFIHYGPTEATVGVLTHEITAESPRQGTYVPLGRPLANTTVYVLDAGMQLAPAGVVGEIFIGGASVARGYLGQPAMTAERFVPDPFSSIPGARLYRTGDVARRLPTGDLEFLGRRDQQVKLRGLRIELGEIVAALQQHPAVARAVAVARDDGPAGKSIVAYVVARHPRGNASRMPESGELALQLRAFVEERLPDYMVPSAIVPLDVLPLTAQGKVDLQALPSPAPERAVTRSIVPPRTLLEARLAELWETVLGVKPIGIGDDFFALGGHSLLAVRLLALVRQRLRRRLPIATLFRHRTIAQLARVLSQEIAQPSPTLVELQGGGGAPVFCVHPIGGNVLCYLALARALQATRPVVGVQAAAADVADPPRTIEAMARAYLAEIERTYGQPPSALVAWSMGGLIAFEMVRQLREDGVSRPTLVLIDTYPPSAHLRATTEPELPVLARFAADLAGLLGKDPQPLREHFVSLAPAEQEALLLQVLQADGVLGLETTSDELRAIVDVFVRNARAAEAYRLIATDQPLVLVAAEAAAARLEALWAPWAPIEAVYPIAADHYGLLQAPHVEAVARHVASHLDFSEWRAITARLHSAHR